MPGAAGRKRVSRVRLLWLFLVALLLPGAVAEAQSVGEVFKRVNPSVVIIRARWTEAAGQGQLRRVSEVGSGVLISMDGQVITAAHVVQTADEITAEFLDGEQVGATVIASEPEADVSLLRLARSPSRPVVARLGDSDRVQVGDQIFIIGAPYGIGHTLSVGHVGARYKPNTVYSGMSLAEFLQTDAAINPGNSGGPMFNMQGEVIGIASHNISRSGGFEGLGFVVTSNMARRLLLDHKSFWTGISGVILEGALAKALNLPQPVGMLIQQVAAKSPSAEIGLRSGTIQATIDGKSMLLGGDIILSVQGIRIGDASYEEIQEVLSRLPSGATVRLSVLRDGQIVELSAPKP
jgi:serine protease Do